MKKYIILVFSIIVLVVGFNFLQKDMLAGEDINEIICIQVITFAKDPETGKCSQFSNPCIVPEGWKPCAIKNFDDCVNAGNPIMESYPRQCLDKDSDKSFTEDIGNEFLKNELIRLDNPRPNQAIESPITIKGEALGSWFFEGDFPIVLTDWDGKIIAEGFVTSMEDSMVEGFVQFEGTLEFKTPEFIGNFSKKGYLILKKDNPSGLPEKDDALEIPIHF